MRLFKILEKDIQSLGAILIEFPLKHKNLIENGIKILEGLEEIKEEINKED